MIIKDIKFTLELDCFIETNVIGVDVPYFVTRIVRPNETVWLGLNTNWRYKNEQWERLEAGEFVACEVPEYELKYQEITTFGDNPF